MSTERPGAVTVRDLAEEAKKRIVFLIVCVVGLSYLMSLTSSSVMVNVPAAVVLIVLFRYLSMDFEMRAKAATYKRKPNPTTCTSQLKATVNVKIERPDWRRKVNSQVVENAIDHFTRHIVSEWVTELWYSKVTPDKQGPEELAQIINGVAGEISSRVRNINIIDLLTRDIINILCSELELFRASQAKIEKLKVRSLSFEERDERLKSILFVENKLHPCLFSAEAEHKVLQHLMDGLISLTFTKEDLQCSLFRYIVRELLACVVIRPVLNLASPRFINEKIESLVISLRKAENKTISTETAAALAKPNGSLNVSPDPFANFADPSSKGLELVQLKKDQSGSGGENEIENGDLVSKDPLLSMDARVTRSWDSLPLEKQVNVGRGIQRHRSGGEWGDMLDDFSERKTKALAPEHFDNMWTKGRDYKRKDAENLPLHSGTTGSVVVGSSKSVDQVKQVLHHKENEQRKAVILSKQSVDNKEDEHDVTDSDEFESGSSISNEDEGTGLDSPSVRVWDGKNKKNITRIHHPLEIFDGHTSKKAHKGRKLSKSKTNLPTRKRSQDHVWQEVERTSFLLGEGLDVLNPPSGKVKDENFSDESSGELCSQISNGSMTSSYLSSKSFAETNSFLVNPVNSVVNDPFFTLRCEVAGANIVKSGSRTFAVYSVSVTDMNNHSWSIKRRYRHFEELHRRLKEFPEYNLHLPPKQFLSTGLDVMVIQQRCKLLDKYLKELMQINTISGSIEVWDFLSVDSQTYLFSSSFSIIETLSVKLDSNMSGERSKEKLNPSTPRKENLNAGSKLNHEAEPIRSRGKSTTLTQNSPKKPTNSVENRLEDSSSESDNASRNILKPNKNVVGNSNIVRDSLHTSSNVHLGASSDPTIPSEWIPPNLCQPILDVVDVVFQLQDGGWIRRKVFWVAKQVLQLGMGDAFDDWLLEKIGLLRRGSVVASGINRIEQILWPDGIFITKHPSRQKPSSPPSSFSPNGQDQSPMSSPKTDDAQQKEAERRAQLVHELMIDKAPGAVVGIVGRKEYDQCANDLYYFIQSSVFMKQLAMDILELLILSAFPELENVLKQVHEEKEKFGNFEGNNIKA